MEEWIKVSAKTVDDAVLEASIQLGTSRDNIDYRVIEHETKGFLGIGAKKAVIEAKKKIVEEEKDIISEVFSPQSGEEKHAVRKGDRKEKRTGLPKDKEAVRVADLKGKPETVKKPEYSRKMEERSPEKEQESLAERGQKKTPEKRQEQKRREQPRAERTPRVPADPKEASLRAENFLKEVFQAMQIEVNLKTTFENETLSVELSGTDMGILIGKRGQTLDSLQYLTSLVVNKGKATYVRIKIDTEDYRERRRATLENLAKNIAFKVKKTKRPVYLEPMNPYERRIIHSALQNDPYVTTHSEGEEPCRKVVVTLRRREMADEDRSPMKTESEQ